MEQTKENALWHQVSEAEKIEIQKQAKKILDEFAKKLEKITVKEEFLETADGMREQAEPWQTDKDFRNAMFANAPFADDDEIIAEKGEWKK